MQKLDHLVWVVEGTYRVGGVKVGVRTNSERFGAWVDDVLAEHGMSRWVDPLYSVLIADQDEPGKRGFHVLYRSIVPIVRTTDLGVLARAFLEEVESFTFRGRDDAIYVGASVLTGPKSTALIPASYTSTLGSQSRRTARMGLAVPASNWAAIDPETGNAVPIRSALGVPEDAVSRLVDGAVGAEPDRFLVDRPTPLDSVCLIHDRPTAAIEPVSPSLTLYRLAGVSENLPALGGRRTLEGLGRLVASADCYGVAPIGTNHVIEAMAHITSHFARVRALT
jgi:hypothetical protein